MPSKDHITLFINSSCKRPVKSIQQFPSPCVSELLESVSYLVFLVFQKQQLKGKKLWEIQLFATDKLYVRRKIYLCFDSGYLILGNIVDMKDLRQINCADLSILLLKSQYHKTEKGRPKTEFADMTKCLLTRFIPLNK